MVVSGNLNAVAQCRTGCTLYLRWRRVGTSTWTNGTSEHHAKGRIAISTALSVQNAPPTPYAWVYEYQLCGREDGGSSDICVGADGRPGTSQRFTLWPGANDWPEYRADSATGNNPTEPVITPGNAGSLRLAFSAPVNSPGAPVVADGRVFVAGGAPGGHGTITAWPAQCAIHGRTCLRPLWRTTLPGDASGATPVVGTGFVIVGTTVRSPGTTPTGSVVGLDAATGKVDWRTPVGGAIRAPVTYQAGLIYVAAEDGYLYALSSCPTSGGSCASVWRSPVPFLAGGGRAPSAPASSFELAPEVFVGSLDGNLYSFQVCCGTPFRWKEPAGGGVRDSAAVAGSNVVYIGSDSGRLSAFAGFGQPLWSTELSAPIISSPALSDPFQPAQVFAATVDGKVRAWSTIPCDVCTGGGQLLWSGQTGGIVTKALGVAGGVVFVPSRDGRVYGFAASGCGGASCTPLFVSHRHGVPSAPAIADGNVYFTSRRPGHSRLVAYALP